MAEVFDCMRMTPEPGPIELPLLRTEVDVETPFKTLLHENHVGDIKIALETLEIYLSNIVKNPDNSKMRRIGLKNKNFQWRVQAIKGAEEILRVIGFQPDEKGEFLVLHDLSTEELELVQNVQLRVSQELHNATNLLENTPKKILAGSTFSASQRGGPAAAVPSMSFSASSRFSVGYADTIGRRCSMEDTMTILGTFRGRVEEDYYALFDGHGGGEAAVFAARNLHIILNKHLLLHSSREVKESLRASFLEVNQIMNQRKMRSGSTGVVAFIVGHYLYVANAGDSRAIIGTTSNRVLRLSLDHKPSLPDECDRISRLGGWVTTVGVPRVNGVLAVSRAFGNFHLQPLIKPDPFISIVDLSSPNHVAEATAFSNAPSQPLILKQPKKPIQNIPPPKDKDKDKDKANGIYENDSYSVLILACDGLWDVVEDEEAVSIANESVLNNSGNGRGALEAAIKLRDLASSKGSFDNISVIVVSLRG